MFDIFNVDLVHGWIIDPQDRETYDIIQKYGKTYNKAVEFIVQLDGNLEQTKKSNINYDDEGLMLTTAEEEKLHEGFIIKEFLKDTATQLTYYGLELLLDSIPEDSLCVLFRNNHFSTVYKHPDLGLYMLITDSGLVLERSIVWESLSDIDQGSSEFLDGFFNKPNTILSPSVIEEYQDTVNTDLDYAIAVSLQESESRQQRQQQQQELNYNSNSSHGNNRQQPEKSGTTVRMKKSSLKRNNCVIC
ncbi:uncharacterized protein BX663DRAFT_19884 [Cokeromyces recurvatus]|uniref:uncharacterized protein n=1 Tax=Cokeromyces recurvatus TaxID=90255 RepID=UPI00221FF951|nr:uncharacterized protein BX663DRAFT_19884 [Cokeromyces recurvatus]KAI7908088.1 hypothetical protein BX663DRAFT_19884 [Cokeromyces recurvatus]